MAYLRSGRPSTPSGLNARCSSACSSRKRKVFDLSISGATQEKLSGELASRSLIAEFPVRLASCWRARSIRSRRSRDVNEVSFVGIIGWREMNSASTRFTIDAHAGMRETYSGLPGDEEIADKEYR